ncbi:MAG: hypothetical protein H6766_05020 [Candidatus Peribacteria bacterium]|nr:MAG: hypothetical protein H6766_05020 [Candidatus Peribacteria bacterium]
MNLPLKILKTETQTLFYITHLSNIYITAEGEIFLDKKVLDPMSECSVFPHEEDVKEKMTVIEVTYKGDTIQCRMIMPQNQKLSINVTFGEVYNPLLTFRKKEDCIPVSSVWWSRKHYLDEKDENSTLGAAIKKEQQAIANQNVNRAAKLRDTVKSIEDKYFASYCSSL